MFFSSHINLFLSREEATNLIWKRVMHYGIYSIEGSKNSAKPSKWQKADRKNFPALRSVIFFITFVKWDALWRAMQKNSCSFSRWQSYASQVELFLSSYRFRRQSAFTNIENRSMTRGCCSSRLTYWKTDPRNFIYSIETLSFRYNDFEYYFKSFSFSTFMNTCRHILCFI